MWVPGSLWCLQSDYLNYSPHITCIPKLISCRKKKCYVNTYMYLSCVYESVQNLPNHFPNWILLQITDLGVLFSIFIYVKYINPYLYMLSNPIYMCPCPKKIIDNGLYQRHLPCLAEVVNFFWYFIYYLICNVPNINWHMRTTGKRNTVMMINFCNQKRRWSNLFLLFLKSG